MIHNIVRKVVVVAAMALTIRILQIRNRKRPKRLMSESSRKLLAQGRSKLLAKILDVGGFFGVDIGGSLSKVLFFVPDVDVVSRMLHRAPVARESALLWEAKMKGVQQLSDYLFTRTKYGESGSRDSHLSFHMSALGGSFHFIRFETRRMEEMVRYAHEHKINAGMHTLFATGGGAHKFKELCKELIAVDIEPLDEIDSLVKGMAFLAAHVAAEAYTFDGQDLVDRPMEGIEYPYLLVNVGSGCGFILVTSETSWQRVSGTSLGGGTYYGLVHSLTGITDFDQMLDAAEQGNNANVDLTVGDIYGGDLSKFGLKASTIAASFGKALTISPNKPTMHSGSICIGCQSNNSIRTSRSTNDLSQERRTSIHQEDRFQSPGVSSKTANTSDENVYRDGSFRGIGGIGVSRTEAAHLPSPSDVGRVRLNSLLSQDGAINHEENSSIEGKSVSKAPPVSIATVISSITTLSKAFSFGQKKSNHDLSTLSSLVSEDSFLNVRVNDSSMETKKPRQTKLMSFFRMKEDAMEKEQASYEGYATPLESRGAFFSSSDFCAIPGVDSKEEVCHKNASRNLLECDELYPSKELSLSRHHGLTSAYPDQVKDGNASRVSELAPLGINNMISLPSPRPCAPAMEAIGGLSDIESDGEDDAVPITPGVYRLRRSEGNIDTDTDSDTPVFCNNTVIEPKDDKTTVKQGSSSGPLSSLFRQTAPAETSLPPDSTSASDEGKQRSNVDPDVAMESTPRVTRDCSDVATDPNSAIGHRDAGISRTNAGLRVHHPSHEASCTKFRRRSSTTAVHHDEPQLPKLDPRDVSRALLIMISNNIGQLAYLNAVKHKCKSIYFAGNFLRHENTIALRTLAYSIKFWSGGEMEGLFLRHEGYCGALGTFLSTLDAAVDIRDTLGDSNDQ